MSPDRGACDSVREISRTCHAIPRPPFAASRRQFAESLNRLLERQIAEARGRGGELDLPELL